VLTAAAEGVERFVAVALTTWRWGGRCSRDAGVGMVGKGPHIGLHSTRSSTDEAMAARRAQHTAWHRGESIAGHSTAHGESIGFEARRRLQVVQQRMGRTLGSRSLWRYAARLEPMVREHPAQVRPRAERLARVVLHPRARQRELAYVGEDRTSGRGRVAKGRVGAAPLSDGGVHCADGGPAVCGKWQGWAKSSQSRMDEGEGEGQCSCGPAQCIAQPTGVADNHRPSTSFIEEEPGPVGARLALHEQERWVVAQTDARLAAANKELLPVIEAAKHVDEPLLQGREQRAEGATEGRGCEWRTMWSNHAGRGVNGGSRE
jgi:hypothetical protein